MKLAYTLRDLVLVTVIVGIALGWWIDHVRSVTLHTVCVSEKCLWRDRCTTLQAWVREDGGNVEWSNGALFLVTYEGSHALHQMNSPGFDDE